MNSEIELDKIIGAINKAKKIGIFTHESPDGDALGSSLALYMGLCQLNKEVDVITDKYSDSFSFLTSLDKIQKKGRDNYDLCISLDCANKERLYDIKGSFDKAKTTVTIDHHASNTFYANYNYVEDKSPAACKTLVKVLKRLSINITKEIGEALMAGIITDTGGFRYETVDDETFEFAAQMLDVGVNISDIYLKTFDIQTKAQFKLTSIATSRLKFISYGRIAITYITLEDIKKTNAKAGDHEGIVNVGRNVEGVEVSIFLREDKDGYKVSFRSNNDVDVSEIAQTFDGGGHTKAAGCLVKEPLEKTMKKLIKETVKRL
jgi:phosphoesterase RecJ-like protein